MKQWTRNDNAVDAVWMIDNYQSVMVPMTPYSVPDSTTWLAVGQQLAVDLCNRLFREKVFVLPSEWTDFLHENTLG